MVLHFFPQIGEDSGGERVMQKIMLKVLNEYEPPPQSVTHSRLSQSNIWIVPTNYENEKRMPTRGGNGPR